MKKLPLSKVYQLIEPGPVVLVTTASRDGRPNVMTLSWHMMVDFEPPLIACVVGSDNHSFKALRASGECVFAIPSVEMAEAVVKVGNSSGREIDKFEAFGLTRAPAKLVRPPLISQCLANLECRTVETRLVNKFNLFVLEVVAAWHDPAQAQARTIHHRGYGEFSVDGEIIRLASIKP